MLNFNSLEWENGKDETFLGELGQDADVKGGYVKVSGVVDTGAEDHALTEDTAPWLPTLPSEASQSGTNFRGPGGESIEAKGRKVLRGGAAEGHHITINGEVGKVRRNLFSAVKIADAGNDVFIRGRQQAYIRNHRTGRITYLRRQGNVWMLDLWLQIPPNLEKGFPRRGR